MSDFRAVHACQKLVVPSLAPIPSANGMHICQLLALEVWHVFLFACGVRFIKFSAHLSAPVHIVHCCL